MVQEILARPTGSDFRLSCAMKFDVQTQFSPKNNCALSNDYLFSNACGNTRTANLGCFDLRIVCAIPIRFCFSCDLRIFYFIPTRYRDMFWSSVCIRSYPTICERRLNCIRSIVLSGRWDLCNVGSEYGRTDLVVLEEIKEVKKSMGSCSNEPIGYEGEQWSLYAYVNGSPLVKLDPTGLAPPRSPGGYGNYCGPTRAAACIKGAGGTWVPAPGQPAPIDALDAACMV